MNLYFALIEEDGGLRIVVLSVDRRNLFIDGGFSQPRHSQHSSHYPQHTSAARQPRNDVILKHRPHFSWWTRQQHDRRAIVIKEHTRSSAVGIRQHDSIFNDHRLT